MQIAKWESIILDDMIIDLAQEFRPAFTRIDGERIIIADEIPVILELVKIASFTGIFFQQSNITVFEMNLQKPGITPFEIEEFTL